jgi:glycine/D-amino acid oxidase-like deaminating enzyme
MLEMEPCIGEKWQGAIFYERDGQVNAGRLTQALAVAAARRGVRELAARAADAVPAICDAPFSRAWSSVRPVSLDGLPIPGPVVSHPGRLISTGHGEYGIALSLITGELVRSWVLGKPEPVDSRAFRLEGREGR